MADSKEAQTGVAEPREARSGMGDPRVETQSGVAEPRLAQTGAAEPREARSGMGDPRVETQSGVAEPPELQSHSTVQTSSGRNVRMTEAGRQHQTELKMREYKRQLRELKHLGLRAVQEVDTGIEIHPEITKDKAEKWIHAYISFVQTHCDLCQLLSPADVNQHSEAHQKVMTDMSEIKVVIESYLKSIQPKKSKQAATRASSSKSFRSGVLLMQLEDERKRVESATKLEMLKRKQDIERQCQELERRKEELKLQTEAEIQKRQTAVLSKFQLEMEDNAEDTEDEQEADTQVKTDHQVLTGEQHTILQPDPDHIQHTEAHTPTAGAPAQEFALPAQRINVPDSRDQMQHTETPDSTSTELLSGLARLLTEQSKRGSLPALEPEVFYGSAEHYHLWIKAFESYIEARTTSSSERLHFLARYTSGEARNAIQGFLHLQSEDAYAQAKKKLEERYGNSFVTAQTYRKRIETWPKIAPGDGKGLQKFADFLESCEVAARTVPGMGVLGDPEENVRMLKLLPRYIVNRWERVVDESLYEAGPGSHGMYPPLREFVRFLKKEARVASGPVSSCLKEEVHHGSTRKNQPKSRARTFLANTDTASSGVEGNRNSGARCKVCSGDHTMENCQQFLQMNVKERHEAVNKYRLCRGCLKPGHIWRRCKARKRCEECGKLHPTILHDNALVKTEAANPPQNSSQTQTHATSLQVGVTERTACAHSMIVPVRIHQAGRPEHETVTYALLDLQSDACFIKESVQQKIHAEGEDTCLQLSTMTGKSIEKTQAIRELVVQPVDRTDEVTLPTTYARSDIPADRGLIPREDTVQKWPHLRAVGRELPPYFEEAEIGVLIGINCGKAVRPLDVVSGEDHEPWAMKTVLGWSVVGILSDQVATEKKTSCHFAFRVSVRETSPAHLMHLFETDFRDTLDERKFSQDDFKFMDMMEKEIHQREDGHIEMPLPLKDSSFSFPNNKDMALKRLQGLKRRMAKDPKFREEYEAFMNEMLEKGYAEVVPNSEHDQEGRVWYVPHHGVYHPKKNKIRVVFDCSAEHKGVSLNSQLLQGPDMSSNLVGVLIRFRKEVVGLSCDVEGMFNQVGVNPEDRNLLRFLWWKNGDITAHEEEYRMTTHLFGATSSPACAMVALQETANRFEDPVSKKAAEFIRQDFYVDDGLTSTPDVESAVSLAKTTIDLCSKGGFRLHKFASNEPEVLKRLPAESRSKDLQEVEVMAEGPNPVLEHALGIKWNLKEDTLGFGLELPNKPSTRRGILSVVSSLYDPLGFVSPFTLQGKMILKQLCTDGCSWDDPVPSEVAVSWEDWKSELPLLSTVSVPRCYAPELGQKRVKLYELHHFCDASLDGYGYCSYLRTITEDGQIASSLVMSKAKVTPKRPTTVPRLELAAAVAAVKGSAFLRKEMHLSDVTEVFWTDSKVVIGYIQNETKRFHVYVANRVQKIRQATSPSQWRYVATEENPADLTSRGARLEELKNSNVWWRGPTFLQGPGELPDEAVSPEIPEDDPEVKTTGPSNAAGCFSTTSSEFASLPERLEYFSSWHRARRAVALALRYMAILLERVRRKRNKGDPTEARSVGTSKEHSAVETEDLKEAERVMIKSAQEQSFKTELKSLKQPKEDSMVKKCVEKKSSLYRLDPFVDNDGLLRIGGRLRRAEVPYEVAHPVILPKHSHVTDLVVRHIHDEVEHSGREATLSEVRQRGYWIIKGRAVVVRCILRCVKCIRLRGAPSIQKMADLPRERVEEAEPFTFTGVDYFGPFYIKERRSELKRWGVMFTCLSSRAVHLETANSLSADAFLNAYRRFIGRRGPVRRLYSDQGTNFLGGKNILKKALTEVDNKKIKDELLKQDCDWVEFKMNVPHASHMGGIWERQIRTARAVLSSILAKHGHSLDDELLRTVMVETEAIINGQPISYTSMSDTNTLEPLTPFQLLTLKSKVVCPLPGRFCKEDLYTRQRWRRVQFLANTFWTRWRREFLPLQHERKRWQATEPNLREGDVVVVVDDAVPRGRWPLGRVLRTYPSDDGLVRKVRVQIGHSEYDRPVHKLLLLLRANEV